MQKYRNKKSAAGEKLMATQNGSKYQRGRQAQPRTVHGVATEQLKAVDYSAFRHHMNDRETTVITVARGTTLAIDRQHKIRALIKAAYFDTAGHCQAARYFIVDSRATAPLPWQWRLRIATQALRLRLYQQRDRLCHYSAAPQQILQQRLRNAAMPPSSAAARKKPAPVWTTLRLTA